RRRRGTHLPLVNEVDEDVAWPPSELCTGVDDRKVARHATLSPRLSALRPCIQRLRRIGRGYAVLAGLQTRIHEIGRHVRDRRISLMVGENDRRGLFPRERNETCNAERGMPYLKRMLQRAAVEFLRQQVEK